MSTQETYFGNSLLSNSTKQIEGRIVDLNGESFYKLSNYDRMDPFLMSIVSASDLWMFVSSSGGMTAGRCDPENVIFPYYTDDKIHKSGGRAGSYSAIRVKSEGQTLLWTPFHPGHKEVYAMERNLYKSLSGNCLIFEEVNSDLHLTFRVIWMSSELYGWVRKSELINNAQSAQSVKLMDGILDILPYGIEKASQEVYSTLMDAYKKSEVDPSTGMGIYSLSSIPVDRAEPSEALKATTVWTSIEKPDAILLSSNQIRQFIRTGEISGEPNKRGIPSAYLTVVEVDLKPGKAFDALMVAEVSQDSKAVKNLSLELKDRKALVDRVIADCEAGEVALKEMVAQSDGMQELEDKLNSSRHFSNVLFNVMRGGIYDQEYQVMREDVKGHVKQFNHKTYERNLKWLSDLPEKLNYVELVNQSEATGDLDLIRLCLEYLPLSFSRRHGDPSRPWNHFAIEVKGADGKKKLGYQGNWRDIFQNWEALSYSFPEFLPGIITKFFNASTIDGYNPYRITSDGIDWEIFDPEDPWSYIGYWGDHQVIYLQKLLELQESYYPGTLVEWLNKEWFVYGHVPYRIRSYESIVENPQDTIDFDQELHEGIERKEHEYGADARLIIHAGDDPLRANMMEKIMVMLLAKSSNFIPGAGIWMNTQRPEWNDANNALVGNGVSMVTLYYMRRFIDFFQKLLLKQDLGDMSVSSEIFQLFRAQFDSLNNNKDEWFAEENDQNRLKITEELGRAGSAYRSAVYGGVSANKEQLDPGEFLSFLELLQTYLDDTIEKNRRSDGLFHAYNLIAFTRDGLKVSHLQEMLEGQVAYLSKGNSTIDDLMAVLKALKKSSLYRADQNSYLLYPDKEYEPFMDKNNLPEEIAASSSGMQKLLEKGGMGIVNQDETGVVHFEGGFNNARFLEGKLGQLTAERLVDLDNSEVADVLDLYESLFNHHAFTGRSGSFFKYEGLGSIYWHMVSKLLLAVGENLIRFIADGEDEAKITELRAIYNDIRDGIGVHKNPEVYGAIPTDPYSHTPSMIGAQQPGMTGQVKEDIISRWLELGVQVMDGKISICKKAVGSHEFGASDELSFTFCGTPFTYIQDGGSTIRLESVDGESVEFEGRTIDADWSASIFRREGKVAKITVHI